MKFKITSDGTRPLKPRYEEKNYHPKARGEQSEAIITARFIEIGYNVLIPFGDNRRYDLMIEDADKHFWRIQCKTGHLTPNGTSIDFSAASSYAHTRAGKAGETHRNYQGEIDYFAVYCPEIKKHIWFL